MAIRKILIVGDAGRGKSTLAEKLSRKLSIPFYSTDDFFWKIKFTEPSDKEDSILRMNEIYQQDSWVVDGTTRHLLQGGVEKADIIYLLEFKHVIPQYYFLITRYFKRKNERFSDLWGMLKHVTRKKYKNGYRKQQMTLSEMLAPYQHKVVRLSSMRENNDLVNTISC